MRSMYPRWMAAPIHLRLGGKDGTMTACGLVGIQHRPLRYTDLIAQVSCRRCGRWIAKQWSE